MKILTTPFDFNETLYNTNDILFHLTIYLLVFCFFSSKYGADALIPFVEPVVALKVECL